MEFQQLHSYIYSEIYPSFCVPLDILQNPIII